MFETASCVGYEYSRLRICLHNRLEVLVHEGQLYVLEVSRICRLLETQVGLDDVRAHGIE